MAVNGSSFVSYQFSDTTSVGFVGVGTNFIVLDAYFVNRSSVNTHYYYVYGAYGEQLAGGGMGNYPPSSPLKVTVGANYGENFTGTITLYKFGPFGGLLGETRVSFTTGYAENTSWIDNTISSSATIGVAYSDSVSATFSPTYTLLTSSPIPGSVAAPAGYTRSIPPGLNHSGGSISGTPTTAGNYAFYIRAVKDNTIYTGWLLITVADPTPTWVDETLVTDLNLNISYSDAVSANNATSYSVNGVSEFPTNLYLLLPGINLNKVTGAITGVPSQQGVFSRTITAANSGASIEKTFSLSVGPIGKRFIDISNSQLLTTFKRYDQALGWTPVNTVKRYNGTSWENITNF
jgi:hypothetical protein